MGNIFDHLAASTYDVVTATMGYDAYWNNLQARVLFNEPAREEYINGQEYQYARPTMEYKASDFPGLKELSDKKGIAIVLIEDRQYYVKEILGEKYRAKDGHSYTAFLERVKP